MSRNTISRITSRIDGLTERLASSRGLLTIVGADEAECRKQVTEFEAAGGLVGRDVQFIMTGVPRSAGGIPASPAAMDL
jgi:hypothetical protein